MHLYSLNSDSKIEAQKGQPLEAQELGAWCTRLQTVGLFPINVDGRTNTKVML